MKLTLKLRREKNSHLKFLKQQLRWLKQDLKQPNPYGGKAKIREYIADNIKETDLLKEELKIS